MASCNLRVEVHAPATGAQTIAKSAPIGSVASSNIRNAARRLRLLAEENSIAEEELNLKNRKEELRLNQELADEEDGISVVTGSVHRVHSWLEGQRRFHNSDIDRWEKPNPEFTPPAEPEIHIAPRKHHLDELADYRRGVMADIQNRHTIPPTFQQISPMTDSDYDNQADNQKQHVAPDIHQTQPITVPDHPQQTITPDIQIPSTQAPDHQVSHLTELIQALQLPKTELIQFNGDPLQYWPFIRAFDNIVERGTNDSAARLARLVQYCTEMMMMVFKASFVHIV